MVTATESTVQPTLGLNRAEARLLDELEDDGIVLPDDPVHLGQLVQELDHVRRPPLHEGRTAVYGAFVVPPGRDLIPAGDLVQLIDLDLTLDECRLFADGRSTFLVRSTDGTPQLACFRRSIQYEADAVETQVATGALIVQRTVLGVPRLFTDGQVTEWNGRSWTRRPTAEVLLASLGALVSDVPRKVLAGVLDLCVHWLSPGRIGATVLLDIDPRHDDAPSLDLDASLPAPPLNVKVRHHYPALFASLMQTDLATLVGPDGSVTRLGVGLRSSVESEIEVRQERGMRHRSAARYTWDHHHTVAVVVSEEGSVTVFRKGEPVRICATAGSESMSR